MGQEIKAVRAAVEEPRRASGIFAKRLFAALEFSVLATLVVIAFVFAEFPESEADEFLHKLMALGRKGGAALCDPAHIESRLLVRMDRNSESRKFGEEFSSTINSKGRSLSGEYSKFQAGPQTICKLRLRVAGQRFCNTDSARMQRLVGRRLQHQLSVPGEPGFYDHGYVLVQDVTQRTVLGWREPGQACPVDVEVVAAVH